MSVAVTGTRTIRAAPETVWAVLDDVDRLALCIVGCRSLERLSPTLFRLVVLVRLGPVRVAFRGTVERVRSEAPRALTLIGRGEGGLAGAAAGTARILLTDVAGGCRIDYGLSTDLTGPFANLGAFVLGALARSLAKDFLATLAALVRPVEGARPSRPGAGTALH